MSFSLPLILCLLRIGIGVFIDYQLLNYDLLSEYTKNDCF